MKAPVVNLLTLLGCAVLAVAVFVWAPPGSSPNRTARLSPLAAFPSGAAFLVTVDVSRLRQTEVGATLTAAGREVPGLGRIGDVCGFDPTAQVEMLAVAVPSSPGTSEQQGPIDFGLVAIGQFEPARLLGCAEAVIRKRGGSPVRTTIGSFDTVRDRDDSSGGEVAVGKQGVVLLGGGSYLRNMIDAAEGRWPTARRDELHTALRRSVGAEGTLVASWVTSPGWLERATGSSIVRMSPLSMVRAAAVRADFSPRVKLVATVGCSTPEACEDIARAIGELGRELLAPKLGGKPTRSTAERLRVEAVEQEVRIRLTLDADEANSLARELFDALTPRRPSRPPASALPPPSPNEVVRPPATETKPAPRPVVRRPPRAAAATEAESPPEASPPPAVAPAPKKKHALPPAAPTPPTPSPPSAEDVYGP